MINRCCMCKKTGESVDHLLLHCDVTSALSSTLFNRLGMSWVMPRRVIDLLVSGPLEGQYVLRCEKWFLFASLCVYGGKGTIGVLRIWKVHWRRFYPRFTILCTVGLRLMCTLCHLVLVIFLFAFLVLFRCSLGIKNVFSLVYFVCTLGCYTLLMIFRLLIK